MDLIGADTPDDLCVKEFVRVARDGLETDFNGHIRSTGSAADQWFDSVIGHLQDIVMDPAFDALTSGFQAQHCAIFDDVEENKLEYTPIFQAWTAAVEAHLDEQLRQRIPNFKMPALLAALPSRKDQVDEELFDTLLSIGDFQAFKELMIAAKRNLQGRGLDLFVGAAGKKSK